MDERVRFVARALEGEPMSALCREFGVSRKTGYKMLDRYREYGVSALQDQRRTPLRNANKLPVTVERLIIELKEEKPDWGARKIRNLLNRRYPDIQLPAKSTVHAVLERNDLVEKRRKRPRHQATGTVLSSPLKPNELWSTDFKGEFRLGNNQYCYPLTVSDNVSRVVFACEALPNVQSYGTFPVFERVFKEHGLPLGMRTDNGGPFSAAHSLFGLSVLSVWFLALGIAIERIKPGCPQQNGRHERMHRTLKKATAKPPGNNLIQQQEKFDVFLDEFNNERPHESLDMKCPIECHEPSPRPYQGVLPFDYSMHEHVATVGSCGTIAFASSRCYISKALRGHKVGISEQDDDIWMVSFRQFNLGFFDLESKKFEPAKNPFTLQV